MDKQVVRAVLERSQGVCELCGSSDRVQLHHIIGGVGKRRECETVESVIALCHYHHHDTNGVHGKNGAKLSLTLKQKLQKIYLDKGYAENEVRKLLGGKLYA